MLVGAAAIAQYAQLVYFDGPLLAMMAAINIALGIVAVRNAEPVMLLVKACESASALPKLLSPAFTL